MKTKIQINSIFGKLLYEYEADNNYVKKTAEKAVSERANLRFADLGFANLLSAERTDYKLKKNPIMLYGFKYPVLIFDKHMEIGCRAYTFAEWENFSLKEIEDIGGPDSRKMWRKYKTMLLDLCKKMRYK